MAAVDNTAASEYLKQRFNKKRIQNLSYEGSPLLAMLPKKEDFGGENLKVPVSFADLKGRSATFSVAQANKSGSETEAFIITTVEDYALFSIKGKTIKQSRGDMNAWLPALEKEAESAARSLSRSASWAVFRRSVGDIAVIDSTVTGTTLTLANRASIQNFEKGMRIVFADPASPYTLRDSGEALTINTIDRDAGSMVVSANLNTIAGLTAADLIIPEGDRNLRFSGLDSWIPSSAPDSTAFFGVDRSQDAVRLGGLRFDATGMNVLEAIANASARLAENGGRPDKLFVNFDKWREIMNYLGSQKVYTQGTAYVGESGPKADVSFQGVRIHGPNSMIDVYADRHCQANTGWLLQMDTWCLHTTGGLPMLLEEDGQSILREATDDAYEGRWGYYGQMYCTAPGYNCRISNL